MLGSKTRKKTQNKAMKIQNRIEEGPTNEKKEEEEEKEDEAAVVVVSPRPLYLFVTLSCLS